MFRIKTIHGFYLQGLLTEKKCDRWPVKKCSLDKAQVQKYTPETKCEKIPREMCAPAGCGHKAVRQITR